VHELAERLLKTIRKQQSIRAGDRVAAAVSGGADSVALLCLLLELRSELGIVLSVAHVNHKLRGEESDEDERFVANLARQHGLELHVRDAPVNRSHSSGIEAAARELRHGFFRQLAREGRVTKVATAHTLDDQAETVLLRIFRGTGIRGLSAVHPRIVFEEQGRAFGELVRPLLGFRRAALQEFLRERGQSWREDSSNRDIAFLRNRVRHRLLPMIAEEFGEAAAEHMAELAEIARAEEEHWEHGHPEIAAASPAAESKQAAEKVRFVSGYRLVSGYRFSDTASSSKSATPLGAAESKQAAEKAGFVSGYRFSDTASSSKSDAPLGAAVRPQTRPPASLPLAPLLALPLAAQRRLVRGWLETNAPDLSISFRLIEQALELARGSPDKGPAGKRPAGTRLELPAGRNLRLGRQELLLEMEPFRAPGDAPDYEYALAVPGTVEVPELGACIEARVVDAGRVPEDERGQLLDLGRMPKQILIRNWRPGDRFWPAHTAAARKVKELLSDRHATGPEKKLWPVAVAEGCGLVWMRGFAVPAAFQAPTEASHAIRIREINTP
jgi:tRNA(Ile)-lysidine synthase